MRKNKKAYYKHELERLEEYDKKAFAKEMGEASKKQLSENEYYPENGMLCWHSGILIDADLVISKIEKTSFGCIKLFVIWSEKVEVIKIDFISLAVRDETFNFFKKALGGLK